MVNADYDLAARLGLKPYSEFEQLIGPLLKPIDPKERKQLLENIYALAAQWMVMEVDKRSLEPEARVFEEKRTSVTVTRAHIKRAV